jgi:GH35 family endo-1,4-beta-xylanase
MLKGARIDAIGMQYHLFNKPRETEYEKTRLLLNPENLYRHLDIFAHFGKPLQITEVTVPAYSWDEEDEEIQAEIIENLYSIWFSHPNVEQIIYWNLVDGYAAWAPQGDMTAGENKYYGGLLRFDMSEKPAYKTLKKLINEDWHTEETIKANGNTAKFRGFYGDYELIVHADGKTIPVDFKLSKEATNCISITL